MSDTFVNNYVKTFRGSCHGIGLSWRGVNDPHVLVTLLIEDDEHWFDDPRGETFSFSSGWLQEFSDLLREADAWIFHNCIPDIVHGRQYGFKFKEGK